MNRKKKHAATKVAGSLMAVMAVGLFTAGCGGSSGGGGASASTATPQITAQPTDQIVSSVTSGQPRKVMLNFSAISPNGAVLRAVVNQLSGNPAQVSITLSDTNTQNADGSVTYNFVAEFEKPATGGDYAFNATISGGGGSTTTNDVVVTLGSNPIVQQSLNGNSGATSVSITPGSSVNFDFTGTTDDQTLVSGVLNPGDGGGTINLDLGSLVQSVLYNSTGTFNAIVTFTDSDGDETSVQFQVVVANPAPPPVLKMELNGVAEVGIATAANQVTAKLSTHIHNEPILLNGVRLTNYPPEQLKVGITFPAPVGEVLVPVVSRSGIGLTFHAPMRTVTGVHALRLFAHAAGDTSNVLEDANLGSPAPMLEYEDASTGTVAFSGEDTNTGGGGNDGSIVGFDLSAAGVVSNIREIQAGNGHTWKVGALSINDGKNSYWYGNSGFTLKLFKTDLSGGVAPISSDVETTPVTNQSPSALALTQDGRPVLLSQEPLGNYRLWAVKSDLSGTDALVHFNVAGQTLPAGTPIAGMFTIVTDGIEYAIVVAGGAIRNVYKVRLDNGTYTVRDIDDATNGFSPEAASLYRDTTFGGYRLDMAGQALTGNGTDFRAMTFRTGQGDTLTTRITGGTSVNAVTGVQGYLDGTAHRVILIRSSESFYEIRNPDNGYNLVSSPTLGSNRLTREMIRSDGLNGVVIGYEGTGGAGATLIHFDGSTPVTINLPVTNYQSLSVGRQSFAIESRSPFHGAMFYHAPSNTTSTIPVNMSALGRTGGGAARFGIAQP